jgi:Flp pilus assembly protein TadD
MATLMGVAPDEIPGLKELRAQTANTQTNAVAKPSAWQDGANASPFDAPTARVPMEDLFDPLDNLVALASPLSTPLPPPAHELVGNDNAGDRESITEPVPAQRLQQAVERSRSAEEQSAPDFDPFAATEPPPPSTTQEAGDDDDEDPMTTVFSAQSIPSEALLPAVGEDVASPALRTQAKSKEDSQPPGDRASQVEETWVVKHMLDKPRSRAGALTAAAILLGLTGLLTHYVLRGRDQTNAPAQAEAPRANAPAASATSPEPIAAAQPEAPVSPAATAEPVPAGSAAEPPAAPQPAPGTPAAQAAAPAAQAAPAQQVEQAVAPADTATPAAAAKTQQPAALVQPEPAPPSLGAEPAASPTSQPAAPAMAGSDATEPQDLQSLLKRAQRLLASNPGAARDLFEQARTLDPVNPHAHAGLSEAFLKLRENSAALSHAQAAVRLRPRRSQYQVLLGNVLAALGRHDEAVAAWSKALELDPDDAEAARRLAR